MKKNIAAIIRGLESITIELDDTNSPKTCASFIKSLPFSVSAHIWGEEIYTDESPITQPEENAKIWLVLTTLHTGQMEKQYASFLAQHQSVKKER